MDFSSSISRNESRNDHRISNSFRRRNLRGEHSSTSGYFAGSHNIDNVGISILKNLVFSSQPILLDTVVVDVTPIDPWKVLFEEYGIGPGPVIISGVIGVDIILTGLLVETLGGLAKMVMKFWLQILNVTFNVMTPYLTYYMTVNTKEIKNTVNCLPSSVCNNTYSGGYQAREEIHYKRC